MNRVVALLTACLLLASLGLVAGSAGDSYELSVQGEIETPSQEEEIAGDDVIIDSVATVDPGDDIVVEATRDVSDIDWDIQLRDPNIPDRNNLVTAPVAGDSSATQASATFDTDYLDLDPGPYLVLLQEDFREFKAAVPVVVSGYELAVDHPTEASVGDEIDVTVELTENRVGGAPEEVEVTVHRPDTEDAIVETAEHVEGDTYEATISLANAEADEYDVYAAAINGDTEEGYPNIVGVGEGTELTVSAADENDEPDDSPPGNGAPPSDENGDSPPDDNETDTGDDLINETNATAVGQLEVNESLGTTSVTLPDSIVETITFNETGVEGNVSVTELADDHDAVRDLPGTNIAPLEITVPDGLANSTATVRTTLNHSAITEQNSSAEEIRLTRLVDGEREPLPTEVLNESADSVTFEWETPGFSTFTHSVASTPEPVIETIPEEPVADEPITFDGSESTDSHDEIVAYEWNIATHSANGSEVTHTFSEPGEYNVTLSVENSMGESATTEMTVTVENPVTPTVTIEVVDGDGQPIPDATVEVGDDGEALLTNESGSVTIDSPGEELTFTVSAEGYQSVSTDGMVDGETHQTVVLEAVADDGTDDGTDDTDDTDSDTTETDTDADDDGPGFGVLVPVIALSMVAIRTVRQRSE